MRPGKDGAVGSRSMEGGRASPAYGVIEYATMLFGAVLGGYVEGSAPLMSFQHGARNDREKQGLFKRGLAVVAVGGLAMFAASQLLAGPLVGAFIGADAGLSSFAANAFRTYSVAFLFFGFTM